MTKEQALSAVNALYGRWVTEAPINAAGEALKTLRLTGVLWGVDGAVRQAQHEYSFGRYCNATETAIEQSAVDQLKLFLPPRDEVEKALESAMMRGDYLSPAEVATMKGMSSATNVYALLGNEQRRAVTFPSAYKVGEGTRAQWFIPRDEAEAWTPRKYPRKNQ